MQVPLTINREQIRGRDRIVLKLGEREFVLDGADAESFLERLIQARAAMAPPVPSQLSRTDEHLVEMNPCWHLAPGPYSDGAVLLVRNSGHGWTGMTLPQTSLARFVTNIQNFLEQPEHPPMLLQ